MTEQDRIDAANGLRPLPYERPDLTPDEELGVGIIFALLCVLGLVIYAVDSCF